MRALLVGGDYVEQIVDAVQAVGFERVDHWAGRKQGDTRKQLPQDVALVVVLTEYVSHPLMKHLRAETSRLGVPVVYARRSLVEVRQKLSELYRKAA